MRTHRRGIVLIGILVLTLVTTLFIGALLQMNPSRLRQTVQEERHDLAAAAAQAGAEYALQRLAIDPDWKGQVSGTTVQTDHMVVRQDLGNVFGWIRGEKGEWAGFRIRFNCQDGVGGRDGLDDPIRSIPSQSISLNNLAGASATKIPLGTGTEYEYEGAEGFMVPERSVALIVEGIVGPGIDPNSADGGLTSTMPSQGTVVTTRTLEGIYQITGYSDDVMGGSVFMGGGNSLFVLGDAPKGSEVDRGDEETRGLLRLSATDQVARMRSKGSSRVAVAPGKTSPYSFYPDLGAEIRVAQPLSFSPTTKAGQTFETKAEAPTDVLVEIAWDKVSTSDQPDRLSLPAGVYTVAGGTSDEGRVKYYPMTFQEYREALVAGNPPTEATVPPDFLSRVTLNGKDWTNPDGDVEKRDLITFEKDVEITEVGENTDFAIVPAGGAKQKAASDLKAVVSSSHFGNMAVTDKVAIDLAVLRFLSKNGGGGPYDFGVGGQTITFDPDASPITQISALNAIGGAGKLTSTILERGNITIPTNAGFKPVPGVQPAATDLTAATGYLELITQLAPVSGEVQFSNPTDFFSTVDDSAGTALSSSFLQKNVDPLKIPSAALNDDTTPQDLEIVFAPTDGQSAAIRTPGSVLLGSHVSGKGGAIVAGGNIDIVGLNVDLEAGDGERDGLSLYAKKDINLSTYDEKRNKYWDASIKGVIFTRGNLTLRLGETTDKNQTEPSWGSFDFLGSMIALGTAPAYTPPVVSTLSTGGPHGPESVNSPSTLPTRPLVGNASVIARGIRLFYEPKFIAPYVENGPKVPIFSAVSVVQR